MMSMEVLDVTSLRPDIQRAKDANVAIKAKLVYRDEEELDTGVQKVQPLPYLDEEIQKYHAQIRDSVKSAQKVNDNVPSEVLQKVDQATQLANEGMTSLFKASQLLEFTFEAYQYARGAAQDQFDLKRRSEQHLKEFENTFKSMIAYRVNAEIPQADLEFQKCQGALEHALDESRSDVRSQEHRAEHEDAVVQESSLQENHDQVQEMVRMERSELDLIGEQCIKDIRSIDEELVTLRRLMARAKQQYEQADGKRAQQLNDNRQEQTKLEERLRVLREEERQFVKDCETGVHLQQQAEEALSSTEKDLSDWRSRIDDLKKRTDTSLSIMTCMEECTGIIMADAKRKKDQWKKRLQQLAVESCWILRECLLVKGAAFMMVLEDNRRNAAESNKLIAHYEKEKISAARSGFLPRVNDAKRSIEQYTSAKTECEEKITDSSRKIEAIREELGTLDGKQHTLRPSLKLDTLENRYAELQEKKTQAFTDMSTEGMTFSFYHKPPL